MRVFRLVKERFADSAFDGTGARRHGGRWNSKGVALIYTSDAVSLAALELLVHLHRAEVLDHYLLCTLDLPDEKILFLDSTALPEDWRSDPPPTSTADIGDGWIRSGASLALAVPSTLVPQQLNVLINPAHAVFGEVLAGALREPFALDSRLMR